jgi:GNAT superfamily N-acetyltransferase
LYAPHPFDQVTADRLCAETSTDTTQVRLVVATGDGSTVQLVAYFILGFELHASDTKRYLERGMPLHSKTDVSLAPVVADEYQSTGVGSLIMAEVLPWLRRRGTKRLLLLGGVRAQNTRAIRFYEKWGMQRVGEFTTSAPCYDMIADLNAEQPHNRPAR